MTVIPNKHCHLVSCVSSLFLYFTFTKPIVCPNTVPCMLAKLPLHNKINHKNPPHLTFTIYSSWTAQRETVVTGIFRSWWFPLTTFAFWARQLTHPLPRAESFLEGTLKPISIFSASFPSSQPGPVSSEQAQPQQKQSKCLQDTKPTSGNQPRLVIRLCNKHESVRKAENTWLFSPPVYKGRSKAPRLWSQPEDSGAQRVPTEPHRTEGSRIRKLPLAARHASHKSRGTKLRFATPQFWASSKSLFVPHRAEEADHPDEQRAGGQPRLRAAAAPLGSRLFLKNPSWVFSFNTLSKTLRTSGTAHHSATLEPAPSFTSPCWPQR